MNTARLPEPARIDALLREGATRLASASTSARLDAELLLGHVTTRSRTELYRDGTDTVDADRIAAYRALLKARGEGEPVAYLLGRREFWSMELEVCPDVLIPRPETEVLVEAVLDRLPRAAAVRILDAGTGSGAIALALAHEYPDARILATDISNAALTLAARNAMRHRLTGIEWRCSDWYAAVPETGFDLIVSNPPYIADHEWPACDPELGHEPAVALRAGPEGLDALRVIVAGAPERLAAGGLLATEHGRDQGPGLRLLYERAGFTGVCTLDDTAGLPRVTLGVLGV